MNSAESKVLPAPPNLVRALLAGFDTIANHIGLILFSIGLDVLLWFGSQIRIYQLIKSYLDWTIQTAIGQTPQIADAMQSSQQTLTIFAERFNLLSVLRAFPFGIPSLMTGRAPVNNPLGRPLSWEVPSFGSAVIFGLAFLLIGIFLGTLFFSLISQAAIHGKVNWKEALTAWISRFSQVLLLTIFFLVLLLGISLPLSCILPFAVIGSGSVGRVVIFMYGAMLLWLLYPLVLSPFGIFIYQDKMWASVLRGVRFARLTSTSTILFMLAVILLSQGLDMLWNIPVDSSWFTLVGILGHAFILSSLLAASFVYYRDAGIYVEKRLQQLQA